MFLNHEELSVHVIYRDPVHDFAFLRCDLAALKVRALALGFTGAAGAAQGGGGQRAANPPGSTGSCLRRTGAWQRQH